MFPLDITLEIRDDLLTSSNEWLFVELNNVELEYCTLNLKKEKKKEFVTSVFPTCHHLLKR